MRGFGKRVLMGGSRGKGSGATADYLADGVKWLGDTAGGHRLRLPVEHALKAAKKPAMIARPGRRWRGWTKRRYIGGMLEAGAEPETGMLTAECGMGSMRCTARYRRRWGAGLEIRAAMRKVKALAA